MSSTKALYGAIAILVVLIIGAAGLILMTKNKEQSNADSEEQKKTFNEAELAAFDGKDGNDCYVAVDGVVYNIEDSPYWNSEGEHTMSNDVASCGRDLSEEIKQSPHGKSNLRGFDVVGELE